MDLLLQLVSIFCVLQSSCPTIRAKTCLKNGTQAPPKLGGDWPLLCHLHLLGGPAPMARTIASMSNKYGPGFTLRLGLNRAPFVNSWELAKEYFTTNDLAMASRPKSIFGEHLAHDYAMVGFSPYGPYWRQIRKILTVENPISPSTGFTQAHISYRDPRGCDRIAPGMHEAWIKEARGGDENMVSGPELQRVGHDFGDVMLSIVEQDPLSDYDNDTVIKATSLAIIFAGTDTSTVTRSWAFSQLLNNRTILKKAQDELDVAGTDLWRIRTLRTWFTSKQLSKKQCASIHKY